MTIYDKRFWKRLSPEIALAVENPENIKLKLSELLQFIDGSPTDTDNTSSKILIPKKLAIQTNDILFQYVDIIYLKP